MKLNTHQKIDHSLNGEVLILKEGYASVVLSTLDCMKVDKEGLVHGGFIFGAADFAAMAAVNDPYVVLAKSETKFLAPVKVGQSVVFEANVLLKEDKKQSVEVLGTIGEQKVFIGIFYTVVLDRHVLS